jgi:hypothetical protein
MAVSGVAVLLEFYWFRETAYKHRTLFVDAQWITSLIGLTLRVLMSYIYGVHILDVSRSHTTTQHSR